MMVVTLAAATPTDMAVLRRDLQVIKLNKLPLKG